MNSNVFFFFPIVRGRSKHNCPSNQIKVKRCRAYVHNALTIIYFIPGAENSRGVSALVSPVLSVMSSLLLFLGTEDKSLLSDLWRGLNSLHLILIFLFTAPTVSARRCLKGFFRMFWCPFLSECISASMETVELEDVLLDSRTSVESDLHVLTLENHARA